MYSAIDENGLQMSVFPYDREYRKNNERTQRRYHNAN